MALNINAVTKSNTNSFSNNIKGHLFMLEIENASIQWLVIRVTSKYVYILHFQLENEYHYPEDKILGIN